AHAADPAKVLRLAINAPETGFDPAKVNDVYSLGVIENINEPLLVYGYLENSLKLRPNTISEMPTFSEDGKVITFHIKPGIYFADDPVFKGKRRELTALDYAYSFKRFADPVVNSPNASTFTDFIVGMDEASARASKSGHFNYDASIAGIQTPDRY
ncbi:ABC transporter substrate-binding protein, partial [Pseudomonas sp. MWU13-2860]